MDFNRLKSLLIVYALLSMLSVNADADAANPTAYKSQLGQDKYVHETFFPDKKNGVFVDIGAHDGIWLSNTYFFETELEWKGVCIEPQPDIFQQLKQNRSCSVLNMGVAAQSGVEEFIWVHDYANMLSGLVSTFDPRHLDRLNREIAIFGGSYEIIKVPTITLNEVLKNHQISSVDYLSIDTEGSELEILMAFDFDTYHVDVIDVENNYGSPKIRSFLKSKGFTFIKRLDSDEIYRNTRPNPEKEQL